MSVLDVDVPRAALIRGHASPFDYLCHAFFESGEHLGCGSEQKRRADERDRVHESAGDCVVWANRGGGKTFLGAVATLCDLVFKPGIAVRILAGSVEQAQRMHEHLGAMLSREPMARMVDGRITQRRVSLINGSGCEVLAQSQRSVRGVRVQKLRCDEVELFDPEIWEAAQLVTRSKRCGDVYVRGAVEALSTMHRPHGLMFRIVRESANGARAGQGGRRVFRWGVVDVLGACPDPGDPGVDDEHSAMRCRWEDELGDEHTCELLDECEGRAKRRDASGSSPGFVPVRDAISLKSRVSADTWRSEMLCITPSRADSVFPEFSHDEHIVESIPASILAGDRDQTRGAWIAGMDFGFRSPTVVLWAWCDDAGVLWIADERVTTGELLADHLVRLLDAHEGGAHAASKDRSGRAASVTIPAPSWIGVDPAGRQRSEQTGLSNIQQMRRAGLVVRDRPMRIDEGLGLIRARLRPASGPGPSLYIHARCQHLIECLTRYRYPEHDKRSLTPVKDGSDHAVDALRYMVQNLDRPVRTRVDRYA